MKPWICGVLLALSAVGCSAPPSSPSLTPAWGTELPRDLSYAPELSAPELVGAPSAVGSPEDLSRRLATPTPRPAAASTSRASGGSSGGSRSTQLDVDVHVHGLFGHEEGSSPVEVAPVRLSQLEALYSGEVRPSAEGPLEQFGYTAFRERALLEAPRTPPSDYRLGPGDEVIVHLTGSVQLQERIKIDDEGHVRLGEVGRVPALGATVEELRNRIHAEFARRRKGFETQVAVSSLRSIRVHVTGHVSEPGPVMIPATGGVLEALAAAGGPLKSGSLRQVLRTQGAATMSVDLYQYLQGEERALGSPLREGETVHVPAVGPTIAVGGLVGAPGIYELRDAVHVGEALELAGGLSPFAFTPRLRIERIVGGEGRQQFEVEPPYVQPLRSGDQLVVEAVEPERKNVRVRISGQVLRPGLFRYTQGMRVSDLLRLADGLTVDAYLPQLILSRRVEQTEGGARAVQQVKVVSLERALAGELAHDLALEPLDWVRVLHHREAQAPAHVAVEGAVLRPGRFTYAGGMRASDLVALAGNPLRTAHLRAELVREVFDQAQGERGVRRYPVDLASTSAGQANPLLLPGDRLIVRSLRSTTVRVQITGEVRFPGSYELARGTTISELVRTAGGVLTEADLRASVFSRASVRRLQQERLKHLAERTRRLNQQALEKLMQDGHGNEALAGRLALEESQQTVARMERTEASGRVVLPLARADFPGSTADLVLESGDRLHIKRQAHTVSVAGHVVNPTTYVAQDGLTVEQAVSNAGGVLEDGDEERVYVIRADGVVQSLGRGSRPLEWDSALYPGDVVLVPRQPLERTFGNKFADGLAAARQMSEIALILGKAASPQSSVSLTSQAPESAPQRVLEGYEAAAGR